MHFCYALMAQLVRWVLILFDSSYQLLTVNKRVGLLKMRSKGCEFESRWERHYFFCSSLNIVLLCSLPLPR